MNYKVAPINDTTRTKICQIDEAAFTDSFVIIESGDPYLNFYKVAGGKMCAYVRMGAGSRTKNSTWL